MDPPRTPREPPLTPRQRPSQATPRQSFHEPSTPTTPARRRALRTSSGGSTAATPNLKLLTQSPQLRSRFAALSLSADALRAGQSSSNTSGTAFSPDRRPTKHGKPSLTVDNIVVLEVGNRFVRAGFAGDAAPQCTVPVEFGWARVRRTPAQCFSSDDDDDDDMYHSLWDLRDLHDGPPTTQGPWYKNSPLRRLETVLEEILFHIFHSELLVDPRQQRVALIENPLWPTAVRASIAKVCLKHLQVASAVFLEAPVLELVAAGLRSGVVVDVGWEETCVYPVYDLRVLLMQSRASTRASKLLHQNVREMVQGLLQDEKVQVPFAAVEAVVTKALYTRGSTGRAAGPQARMPMAVPTTPTTAAAAAPSASTDDQVPAHELDFSTFWPDAPNAGRLTIPNDLLQHAVNRTFLHPDPSSTSDPAGSASGSADDDETDLPTLLSTVLSSLSMDIRGAAQSCIVFSGLAAAAIPGLPSQLLQATRQHIRKRDIAAASSVMAASSGGAWTGASLYMSSLAWYFAQDERIRLPGELSRERYATVGYEKSTAPFGVVW